MSASFSCVTLSCGCVATMGCSSEVGSSSVRLPCCARLGRAMAPVPHTQSQGPRRRVSAPHQLIMTYDIAVIGGGIVGLSFAMQATEKFPRLRVLVLEKEAGVARHQTGHNSGVIHSGVYYKAGSLKARLCVAGAREMGGFCSRAGVSHKGWGQLIVATASGRANPYGAVHGRRVCNRDE